jgi:hypothetical protein
MTRSRLAASLLPSNTYTDAQRRVDEEEAAIAAADTSHLDNKRVEIYIDSIRAETEKAYHCRVGYWRSHRTYMAWIPKSQIEFTRDDRRRGLFRFCVSGDNQPFNLERKTRLCQLHPNCLMSC